MELIKTLLFLIIGLVWGYCLFGKTLVIPKDYDPNFVHVYFQTPNTFVEAPKTYIVSFYDENKNCIFETGHLNILKYPREFPAKIK